MCQHCGKTYRSKHDGGYCSLSCYWARKKKNYFTCKTCGELYYRAPSHEERNGGFCSKKCFGIYERGANNPNYKHGQCVRYDKKLKGRFKSFEDKFYIISCLICKEPFAIEKHKFNRALENGREVYCSRVCASIDHSERIKGENNGRYVHGNCESPYPREFSHSLRESIRKRQGRRCLLCDAKENGKKLDVHHINYDKHNNSPLNLVALCHTCHGGLHGSTEQREQCKEKLLRLLSESLHQNKPTI
jgi:hypothetical protein